MTNYMTERKTDQGSGADWDGLVGTTVDLVYKESRLYRTACPLSIFDYDALCLVNDLVEQDFILSDGLRYVLLRIFNETCTRLEEDADTNAALMVNDLAVFGGLVFHEDTMTDDMHFVVNGLGVFFGPGRDYLHGVSAEERRAAVALATVVTLIEDRALLALNDPRGSLRLRSMEASRFIMAHPDEAREIAEIMNDRGEDDVSLLAEVLGAEHRVLRVGVL